ncbi:MAG TPA: hypothetical protein VFU15_10460 [Bacteroidia bacterium]|nr:hypothetical protein [Bacteroidia bacterium]
MKRIFLPVAVIVIAALAINSCKKDTTDTDTTAETDNSICENEFMRTLPTVNSIAIDDAGVHRTGPGNTMSSSCPSHYIIGTQWPKTLVIDYGTGCTDPVDGKVRKGRIRCVLSNSWDSIGTTCTMSLDTFFVGAIQFEGTCTITRTGTNTFHKVVTNGKCTKSGTSPWTVLWDCDRTIEYQSGLTDSTQVQVIKITGTNHGTDRNGKTWSSDITTPIIRDMDCSWLTSGVVDITPEGKPTRTVNFGDGTCDNKGTITVDGSTFEFTMQ